MCYKLHISLACGFVDIRLEWPYQGVIIWSSFDAVLLMFVWLRQTGTQEVVQTKCDRLMFVQHINLHHYVDNWKTIDSDLDLGQRSRSNLPKRLAIPIPMLVALKGLVNGVNIWRMIGAKMILNVVFPNKNYPSCVIATKNSMQDWKKTWKHTSHWLLHQLQAHPKSPAEGVEPPVERGGGGGGGAPGDLQVNPVGWLCWWLITVDEWYPLVNIYLTMEDHHV